MFTWKIYISFDESAEASRWILSTRTMADECCLAWFIDNCRERKHPLKDDTEALFMLSSHSQVAHFTFRASELPVTAFLTREAAAYDKFRREFLSLMRRKLELSTLQGSKPRITNSNRHRGEGRVGLAGRPGKRKGCKKEGVWGAVKVHFIIVKG